MQETLDTDLLADIPQGDGSRPAPGDLITSLLGSSQPSLDPKGVLDDTDVHGAHFEADSAPTPPVRRGKRLAKGLRTQRNKRATASPQQEEVHDPDYKPDPSQRPKKRSIWFLEEPSFALGALASSGKAAGSHQSTAVPDPGQSPDDPSSSVAEQKYMPRSRYVQPRMCFGLFLALEVLPQTRNEGCLSSTRGLE